ncbi:MAG: hypothetical protein ABWZ40_04540, partial [Caulobacterales bacterium]
MKIRKWLIFGALAVAALVATPGCVSLFLPKSPTKVVGPPAVPPVLGALGGDPAIATSADWMNRRAPILREDFQNLIYGRMPAHFDPVVTARKELDIKEVRDFAYVDQFTIQVSDKGPKGEPPLTFNMLIFMPKSAVDSAAGPSPILIAENFCGNRALFHRRPVEIAAPLTKVYDACNNGNLDWLAQTILGKYINGPPIERVMRRGYALAEFYAGDIVADEPIGAPPALERLADGATPRTGAIIAWAWAYSRAIDVLSSDPRFDKKRMVLWGHSRNGKSALVAAAFDPRVSGVIAHQSGRGGAALSRSTLGETVAEITEKYPYWFAPDFKNYAGMEQSLPSDQHQLIALIAPRPVLFTGGRSDGWADPEGAFRAIQGAQPVYRLMGAEG